jgi:hypothetical protein
MKQRKRYNNSSSSFTKVDRCKLARAFIAASRNNEGGKNIITLSTIARLDIDEEP